MEDLNKLYQLTQTYPEEFQELSEEFLLKLRIILWGQAAITANKEKNLSAASPQQIMKRAKRLTSLSEGNEVEDIAQSIAAVGKTDKRSSSQKSKRSNAQLLAAAEAFETTANATETEAPVATPNTQMGGTSINNNRNLSQEILRSSEETDLMPPPSVPVAAPAEETLYKRPSRAAKLKSEKNLKEPSLNSKLRRPTNEIKIKLEHEQRQSQIHEGNVSSTHSVLTTSNVNSTLKSTLSNEKSDDSLFIIPGKQPSLVSINSDCEDSANKQKKSNNSTGSEIRELCVKIKREKVSLESQENRSSATADEAVFKLPAPMPFVKSTASEEISLASSILSSTTNTTTTAPAKKIRKKKDVVHKPIKVERFSDLDSRPAPISSRTRQGPLKTPENTETSEETKRPPSIYEDAVEAPPMHNSNEYNNATVANGIVHETINLGKAADATINLGPVPNDATFCTNQTQTTFQAALGQNTFVMDTNPNDTITIKKHSGSGACADATFDVNQVAKTNKEKDDDVIGGQRSFETAKDSSMPNEESLITEDEQEKPNSKVSKTSIKPTKTEKTATSSKAIYKMPTRTNELFNPLAQSPVKMRVEAFENAAAAATLQSKRPLRSKKENTSSTSNTTPVIGKLPVQPLGRFLTPTQSSNITVNSTLSKKVTTSASKALPMLKSASASSLLRSNSTASTKTVVRENSAEDFRKGLHSLAEERKKLREQKHLLAAQQREAKERERAERMAKMAKEREEKRKLKKQQEQEQKKRELEEIQRKLHQQKEEEEKMRAAKDREMQLLQMKQQQQLLAKQKMMPPPPKTTLKYTFEMLHEDDSTDDEDKVSYKRPPPPSWSRSHVRGPVMLKQEYTPSAIIDSFFSVQPMTPDLKIIFPNIDARHLKRNSSVFWSTPPRYSELPKY